MKAKKGGGDERVQGHCRVFIEPWQPTNSRMVELDLDIPLTDSMDWEACFAVVHIQNFWYKG